jgi:hypothetical protein
MGKGFKSDVLFANGCLNGLRGRLCRSHAQGTCVPVGDY